MASDSYALSLGRISPTKVHAQSSVDSSGSSIGKGSKSTRVVFGNDDRFSIAIKDKIWQGETPAPKLTGLDKHLFVPIKLNEQTVVYASIASLSSRLGLSEKDILSHAKLKDGSLERLIDQKIQYRKKVLDFYQETFDSYERSERKMCRDGIINKELLMKVAVYAIEHFLPSNLDSDEINFTEMRVSYLLRRVKVLGEEDKVEVIAKKYLARGSYGEVFESALLGKQDSLALKQSRVEFDSRGYTKEELEEQRKSALKSIKNEYKMLVRIYDRLKEHAVDGVLRGIQDRPYELFEIKGTSGEATSRCLLGRLCKGDLKLYYKESSKVKKQIEDDLLWGLFYLSLAKIVHEDIKEDNVLIKQNGQVGFSDLGGGCDISSVDSGWHKKVTKSRPYTHKELHRRMENACFSYDELDTEENRKVYWDRFKAAGQRNDLFSLGILLYKLYNKGFSGPFPLDKSGYPKIKYDKLDDGRKILVIDFADFSPNVSESSKDLIKKLLDVKNFATLQIEDLIKERFKKS